MQVVGLLSLALALAVVAAPAPAAVLVEGRLDGQELRIVADAARGRAIVRTGATERLIDVDDGTVHAVDGDVRTSRLAGPGPAAAGGARYRLDRWSHGARVAGHRSHYHVLWVDGRICAEVLVGRWSPLAVEAAVKALDLVERLDAGLRRPASDGCGVIPFRAFAAAGWPLMAGLRDRTAFETRTIRFDYVPGERERALLASGRTTASR